MRNSRKRSIKYAIIISLIIFGLHIRFVQDKSSENSESFFFNSKDLQVFRNEYLSNRFLITNSSFSFLIRGHNAGFTSYLNNALNLFLFADMAHVPFHLHVQSEDWAHISWLTFFEDFTQNSDCPIVLELDTEESEGNSRKDTISRRMPNRDQWLGNEYDSQFPFLIDGKHSIPFGEIIKSKSLPTPAAAVDTHYFVRPFGENFEGLLSYSGSFGSGAFKRKSLMAQALWNPRPVIRDSVNDVLVKVFNNESVLAVHIRKGDKVKEAQDTSVSRYVERSVEICKAKGISQIFVFSDHFPSIEEFERQVLLAVADHEHIVVYTLPKLQQQNFFTNLLGNEPLKWNRGYQHWDFMEYPRPERLHQTKELIISLSIAAKSSQMLCTMSSNVCRFMGLLLGSLESLHDIDGSSWYIS